MEEEVQQIVWNKYQTPYNELHLENYPDEVREQFFDFVNNVPYIKNLISPNRLRAKDLERDDKGRIIVDIVHPHILEDMDYFRPSALHFKETGRYTDLRPNPNPNSEYGRWIREEIRRCYEGYVRESDGEWVTGNMYFFMNYWPIEQLKLKGKSKKGERRTDFPEWWEGIYYRYHYIEQAQYGGLYDSSGGRNGCEISSRGKSKSYTMSSIMGKYFLIGETFGVNSAVKCMVTAYQKQYLSGGDGILNKFQTGIDFLSVNTQFPNKKVKNSLNDMQWMSGYWDLNKNVVAGTKNVVMGVSVKDDISKVRGKRLHFIIVEEFGSFKNVLELYNIMLPSVQEGDISFGTMYLIGTAGDDESDFAGAAELVYNPKGYRMYALPNDFDKVGQGRNQITFFFPGYMNRKGCYDENGNSDVTKALLEILYSRYVLKTNSSDLNSVTKAISEIPITPQEAILRTRGNMFPITQLNERLNQLDNNINEYDDVYTGDLVMEGTDVKFVPTNDMPVRKFPHDKDNKPAGAIEIFNMPEKNSEGKVFSDRYIAGLDPIDDDYSGTMSLMSIFIMDLWTDKIVCEWTGRLDYADDGYERVRLMLLFYNARCLYENNKKGIFAYFSMKNCLYLLADVPEYLRDKELVKGQLWGNKAKGYNATLPINNYANTLIRNWLIKPVPFIKNIDGNDVETTVSNLYFIRNRALLQELIAFNPDINVDRVRALGALMLYREEKIILYGGDVRNKEEEYDAEYLGNDDYFTRNFDDRKVNPLWDRNKN